MDAGGLKHGILACGRTIVSGYSRYMVMRRLGYSATIAGLNYGKLWEIEMRSREIEEKSGKLKEYNKPIGSYVFKDNRERKCLK